VQQISYREMLVSAAMAAIRSIERALELLRVMNLLDGSQLRELHLRTGLPRPTVYRILATLRRAGYVRAEGSGRYRLTRQVRELGSGYTDKSLIVDVASPIALRVTRQIRWPLAIGTLDGDAICVRYSTMPYSPLAVQATTLGHRLGLLESAMGHAYLAYCPAAERRILIELLQSAAGSGELMDRAHLDGLLKLTRRRGYGLRLPPSRGASATVAAPVCVAGQVQAILSMTTFGRAMTQATLARYVPVLRSTAAEIAAAFTAAAAVAAAQA
jgi:IclR family transcriptional regulator, mhp operon transcriptional activator